MSGAQDARILFGRVEVEAGRLGRLDELRQQRDDESDDEARSFFFGDLKSPTLHWVPLSRCSAF